MTKRENFVAMKGFLNESGNYDFDAFIDHEIKLLSKKASGSKAPTKRQKENDEIKTRIFNVLDTEGQTVTEILKLLGDDTLTNQRVSALLRTMTGVEKKTDKRKTLFFLA